MRKITTLFTMLMLFAAFAFGQNRTITGIVTDETGAPVPGASIRIKNTKTGVAADINGQFRILAKTGDILEVTGANIELTDFTVGAGSTFTIQVKSSTKTESEVVVTTALGIKRQQRDLGYATATIKNEQLTQSSPLNALNGLQGKVSGVNIATMDNSVFENVKINIRGIRSILGNNDPLLVLDGVQTQMSYFSSINPNDIEDINILKGSSAAAIYGPDARNGVVIVTTKKGTKLDKTEVSFSHTTQVSRISFYPKFQEQFGSGGYGSYTEYENWSFGPAFDGSIVPLGSDLKDGTRQLVPYTPNNSRKKFFNTGVTIQNDVSINAKNMFFSVQDVSLKGIVPGDQNRRTGLRLNSSREFGKFKIGIGVNYIRSKYEIFDDVGMANYNAGNNVGLNSGLLNLIFNTPAQVPLTNYKNWKNDPFSGFDTYFNHYGLNPYMAIDTWREFGLKNEILANLELNYNMFKGLNFTWRIASNVRNQDVKSISTGQIANAAINVNTNTTIPGYVSENSIRANRISSEFFGTYTKAVGNFTVNALAGTYVRQSESKRIGISNTGIVVPGLFAVTNRVGEYEGGDGNAFSQNRLFSVFGSAGLKYKNWFNLEFTGRNDIVSWLDPSKNSYFYPGVNAALVLTDAFPSLKSKALSYMKLRLSWNKTGNADAVGSYELAPTFSQTGGFPYGNLAGYTANNSLTNPLIEPEFIETYEAGVEVNLFKNRVSVGASYYLNKNTDQIIGVQVSSATGYTSTKVNAASFDNKGIEFDLAVTPLLKLGEWKINFSGNASYNNSNVIGIFPGLDRIFVGGFTNASNYAVVGRPAFTFMVKDYDRDSLGRIIVSTSTGLPTVNPNLQPIGRSNPKWVIGLTPSVTWKTLTFNVVAEYKTGHMGYGRIGNEMAWTGVAAATAYNNRERFVIPNSVYLDPTSGKYIENKNITINDVTDFYTGVYRQAETNFLYSADSWRIREVSLTYGLPRSIFGNSKFFKSASITANARNLFLWVPKSNQFTDPDFNFDGGNSNGVTTSSINPATRTMGATLNLTF
ncbi:MAG: SusC/RagA family TonB-linked outer membrane protein [Chitinophagaceae bacterium]